jgi:hypothetical protein
MAAGVGQKTVGTGRCANVLTPEMHFVTTRLLLPSWRSFLSLAAARVARYECSLLIQSLVRQACWPL